MVLQTEKNTFLKKFINFESPNAKVLSCLLEEKYFKIHFKCVILQFCAFNKI